MINKIWDTFVIYGNINIIIPWIWIIEYNDEKGFIIEGIVLNAIHAERLVYFSNRRISEFDDLNALFYSAMLINEKIDLEIANERFVARLGNNLENLTELKRMIKLLNDYYYQFIRDKK